MSKDIWRSQGLRAIVSISSAIAISYYIYLNHVMEFSDRVKKENGEEHVVLNRTNVTHIILWWNQPIWVAPFEKKCGNCITSTNRGDFNKSSAVVFSLADGNMGTKPPIENIKRNQNQIWVAFSLETNVQNSWIRDYKNKHWKYVFNWTWNYRPSADIFMPYGRVSERLKPLSKNYSMIFQRKNKFAAWAVSHCNAHSLRDKFVKKMNMCLQKQSIDIFGKCGPLRISKSRLPTLLNNDYKFYLAFENAFCDDYVTEKIFANYNNDIIIVVRGKANYTNIFPKGSFINTKDFRTISDLVRFLNEVSENETLYSNYLIQKDKFQAWGKLKEQYKQSICDICRNLNDPYLKKKTIFDAEEELGQCIKPNDI
ncbi:alpha-(1,3)-fucosyltransferase C-like [Mya arenaria]|uniref:alpha-(1,3)-fucosyltransferase C-like n=1 Tax=Mya arenaria TaxID=6604 RepID=UPI0022E6E9F5|nr:alpha-(1,3)-fucosyltransferase C-like isoform X1 [Mya arenaria]XP_052802121.1 alpha-(1,3)-fucosyltransferase C-like [Mya arenaria]